MCRQTQKNYTNRRKTNIGSAQNLKQNKSSMVNTSSGFLKKKSLNSIKNENQIITVLFGFNEILLAK